MKATGVVRKIDELGRVVIPKEIRRTLRIREGDPLEIFTEHDGEVIFKKYSPVGDLGEFAVQIGEALYKSTGTMTAVTDRDSILAVNGIPRREMLEKPISGDMEQMMEQRKLYRRRGEDKPLHAAEGTEKYTVSVAAPILSEGDVMGCILFLNEDGREPEEVECKLAQTMAGFLGRQLES